MKNMYIKKDDMDRATEVAKSFNNPHVGVETLLYVLLDREEFVEYLITQDDTISVLNIKNKIKAGLQSQRAHVTVLAPVPSYDLEIAIKAATATSLLVNFKELAYIEFLQFLIAINHPVLPTIFNQVNMVRKSSVIDLGMPDIPEDFDFGSVFGGNKKMSNKQQEFLKYTTHLNKDIHDNPTTFSMSIARDPELLEMERVLLRKSKNSIILTGEPGVGKSNLVDSFVYKILNRQVHPDLQNLQIHMLNIHNLLADIKFHGILEARLANIISVLEEDKDKILFIDEIHMLQNAGSNNANLDIMNFLKAPMSKNKIRVIGATTNNEYRKYVEKNAAFSRRFCHIDVVEPSVHNTIEILNRTKHSFEKFYNINISDEVVSTLVTLTDTYVKNRFNPDKSLDILDSMLARKRLTHDTTVTTSNVFEEISIECRIPSDEISKDKSEQLESLKEELNKRIIGQGHIFNDLIDTLYVTSAGLREIEKPMGSFLFQGATSSGKAQPLHSKVKTPTGWSTIGDLNIGDDIVAADGSTVKVVNTYDQGIKDNYLITFDDGRTAESCDEHLWKVYNKHYKKAKSLGGSRWRIKQLKDVINSTRLRTSGYYIPLVGMIDSPEAAHIIEPYFLGILLGDGVFQKNSVGFSNPEPEIISYIENNLMENCDLVEDEVGLTYRIRYHGSMKDELKRQGTSHAPYQVELSRLGLKGHRSYEKFIPDEYKVGSFQQRVDIIAGLVDTDGHVCKKGSISINTSSKQLANDIVEVARSIGCKASLRVKEICGYKNENGIFVKCLPSYIVSLVHNNPEILTRIPRKLERIRLKKPRAAHCVEDNVKLRIRTIEYVGKTPMRCIEISHPEHLYITDNYVVTHNTESCRIIAEKLGIPLLRYDMSAYQEKHTISTLIGSPPGYVGYSDGTAGSGKLINDIEKNPHCVLLLDEIEKAHPDIMNLLLQVMDYGKLTSSAGKDVYFNKVILVMTSNLGSKMAEKNSIGFGNSDRNSTSTVDENITQFLAPEFRARLDGILKFKTMGVKEIEIIAKQHVDEFISSLSKYNITMNYAHDVIEHIAKAAIESKLNARYVRNYVSKTIKTKVAKILLQNSGKFDQEITKTILLENNAITVQ